MLAVKETLTMILERLCNIGEYKHATKNVNTTANSDNYVEGATITLDKPGVYNVIYKATFPSTNAEGPRRIQLYNKTSGSPIITCGDWDNGWSAHAYSWIITKSDSSSTVFAVRVSASVVISGVQTNMYVTRLR